MGDVSWAIARSRKGAGEEDVLRAAAESGAGFSDVCFDRRRVGYFPFGESGAGARPFGGYVRGGGREGGRSTPGGADI